ncbi:MAG: PKD domain-containing protein [Bacteroidia bacterium]
MRHLLLLLLVSPLFLLAQTPQFPAYYGGSPTKTLDLREGVEGSIRLRPTPDFDKFNSRYRSMLPKKRKCSTLEIEKDRQAKNGSETLDEFEEWLQNGMQRSRGMRRRSIGESEILTLPVVVHIIYSNATENISQEQIMSQLKVLNQDYRRRNPDANQTEQQFQKIAADAGIEFCLAKVDPNGNPTSGIDRISLGGSPFSDKYINDVIKPTTIWDPLRYMNLWVCNITGGILGFAQFPSSSGLSGIPSAPGAENTDGVVMHYNAFGTIGTANPPFNYGRTATHEIGHWLGLRHVWGDGACDVDDFCKDTPPTANATYNCPSGLTGCFGAAMFQNYMDYTNDGCMNLFTKDQRTRMRQVLQNSPRRMELLESDVCQVSSEPPVADFKVDLQLGGSPMTANFTNLAEGDIVSYNWRFPGGEPAASTITNPSVTYSQSGLYTVSLTVINTAGITHTKQEEAYIWVVDKGVALPFALDFESPKIPPGGTLLYDPFEEGTWTHTARTGGNGSSKGALLFNNYDHKLRGDADWLLTRYLDFSKTDKPVISFDVAYAKYGGMYSDTLGVFISVGGSSVFEAVYYRGGKDLATAADYVQTFSPFPEEWRTEAIDLSAYAGEELVQIAFVNLSGYGNNLYIDNVRIGKPLAQAPKPVFSADYKEICAGETVSFSNATPGDNNEYRWAFSGGIPATDSTPNPEIQYLKPGRYEVTLTVNNDAGSNSLSQEGFIIVSASPDIELTQTVYEICPGQSVTMQASGNDQYSWYNADESIELGVGKSLTVKPQTGTAYTLLGENAVGCDATRQVEVRIKEVTGISFSPLQTTICKGQSAILRGEGDATFSWSPTTSLSRIEGPVVTANPTENTTYTARALTKEGCTVEQQIKVSVTETPSVYIAAAKKEICVGEEVRIRATGEGPFTWTANGTKTEYNSGDIRVSPEQTTEYEVSAGGTGCQAKASLTIAVKPKPEMAALKPSYVICDGAQAKIEISGAASVQWLDAPGIVAQQGIAATVSPAKNQRYRAIATAPNGCTDTIPVSVAVAQAKELRITNTRPTLCPGMYTTLEASEGTTFRWSPQIGLSTTNSKKVIARPPASTTYFLTATDENGCVSRARTTVTVGNSTSPRADFEIQRNRVCAGETIRLVDASQNATGFSWEFPGATPAFSDEQNPLISYDYPGTYTVRLRVSGCNGSDFIEKLGFITVGAEATLSLNQTEVTACKGDSIYLSARGAMEYTWSPSIGLNTTSGNEVVASPEENTTYTVSGIDNNGCEAEATVEVSVTGEKHALKITSFTSDVCAGESVKLAAQGSDRYAWYNDAGVELGRGAEISFEPKEDVNVTVVGKSNAGCESRLKRFIAVKPAPAITLKSDQKTICAGEEVTLIAEGALQFNWEPAPGLLINQDQGKVTPLQDHTYRVSGTDGLGCAGTAELTIDVQNGRELMLRSFDTELCPGESTIITALGGTSYSWAPDIGLDTTGGSVIEAAPNQTTTYVVKSEGQEGCPAVASITIEVFETNNLRIFPPIKNICAGEKVSLKAEGAANITWASGPGLRPSQQPEVEIRPSRTATYRASGQDANGCTVEGTSTINLRKADYAEVQAASSVVCLGESLELEAKGGSSYQWLDAPGLERPRGSKATIIPQEKTTYTVVVTDSIGCTDSASIEVDIQQLDANFILNRTQIDLAKEDGLVSFEDKTQNANEWLWDFGDGGESEEASPKHFYDQPGTYLVTMAVTDGVCIDETSTAVTVVNTSSLAELEDADALSVSQQIKGDARVDIEIESERPMRLRYRVLDNYGTAILTDYIQFEASTFKKTLDLSTFGSGKYLVQLTDGEETWDQSVVVE